MSEVNLYSQFDRSVGCRSVLCSLLIRDVAACANDHNFAPPYLSRSVEDRAIGNRSVVPVARHNIHVFSNRDAAIVNREGSTGAGKLLLHSNVSGVRKGFIIRNPSRKLHDLFVRTRRMKVVAFGES